MTEAGIYRHPPGRLSRWGVVDVGLKCVHSCKHCFYSFLDDSPDQFRGMRRAGWHKTENLVALVDSLAEQGFIGFDITGGEPTAHPGLVDLVTRAAANGTAARVITLGQFLGGKRDLLGRLIDAGLVDFRFSLHSTDPAMFHRMTGGDLSKLVAAMDELQRRNFHYVTNTTITEQNYAYLPEIAKWIAERPEIYQTTFLFFMPYYQWSTADHSGDHRVRYSEIAAHLREAVAIVEDAGIGCTIRYAPQCTIAGMEKNHVGIVGVRHDPHEWMNAIDHRADPAATTAADMRAMGHWLPIRRDMASLPLLPASGQVGEVAICGTRAGSGKVFPAGCRNCPAINVCDGVDPAYLSKFGAGELQPYTTFRGDLIDRDRLAYLPAHIIKTQPLADARGAVRAAFETRRGAQT
jgi:pyrroloquinoline quinone biosynthesis protein E